MPVQGGVIKDAYGQSNWRESGFLLAILAIVIIALFVEFYPPIGWGLTVLAVMAMIGNYYMR